MSKNKKSEDKKQKANMNYEVGEDATKYGEFVPSFDAWVTPDRQRKIARKLENPGTDKTGGRADIEK